MSRPSLLWDICSNTIVKLSATVQFEYVIISHVWGDATNFIQLEGVNWMIPISYPGKLEDIRTCLRMHCVKYAWIDILCINQDDDTDKMREVPKMEAYYKLAQCCYICLDTLPDETLKNIYYSIKVPSLLMSTCENYIELASSVWWERLWTWQEAILPCKLIFVDIHTSRTLTDQLYNTLDMHDVLINGTALLRILNEQKRMLHKSSNLLRFSKLLYERASYKEHTNYISLRYALASTHDRLSRHANDALYGIVSFVAGMEKCTNIMSHDSSFTYVLTELWKNEIRSGCCSMLLNTGKSTLRNGVLDKFQWGFDIAVDGHKIRGRARELHELCKLDLVDKAIVVTCYDKFVFDVELEKSSTNAFSAAVSTRMLGETRHCGDNCRKLPCQTCGLHKLLNRASQSEILFNGHADTDLGCKPIISVLNNVFSAASRYRIVFSGCCTGEQGIAVMLLYTVDNDILEYAGWALMEVDLLIAIHRLNTTSVQMTIGIPYIFASGVT